MDFELHNADCFDFIKTLKDGSVDLVVTDPPYLITDVRGCGSINRGESKHNFKHSVMALKGISTGGSINDKGRFNESIFKITGGGMRGRDITKGYDIGMFADLVVPKMRLINIYFWCNKRQIPEYFDVWIKKYKCAFEILSWHKKNTVPSYSNHYKVDTEFCLYFHKNGGCRPESAADATTYFISNMNVSDKKRWKHPTIKPLEMIERLVRNSSSENQTVLDPFMGSGTTGVACRNMNRNFIGVEIDKDYFDMAKRRIAGTEDFCTMPLFEGIA